MKKLFSNTVHLIFIGVACVIVGSAQQQHRQPDYTSGTQYRLQRQEDHIEYDDALIKQNALDVKEQLVRIESLENYISKLTGGAILLVFLVSVLGLMKHFQAKPEGA